MMEDRAVACPRCGAYQVGRFCSQCGQAISMTAMPPSPPCIRCHAPLPPGARFCSQCGLFAQPPVGRKRSVAAPLVVLLGAVAVVTALLLMNLVPLQGLAWSSSDPGTTDPTDTGPGGQMYSWRYGGKTYTLGLDIPQATYLQYKEEDVARHCTESTERTLPPQYVTPGDATIIQLASLLSAKASSEGLDREDTINFALAFVQAIPYSLDGTSTDQDEYWRFPVETLYDRTGDCEDKTFLFASLIEAMDQDAVVLLFYDHMAAGVACPEATGSYYSYYGTRYYCCETTYPGWAIGEFTDDYSAATVVQVS